jgi:hypothetical protein
MIERMARATEEESGDGIDFGIAQVSDKPPGHHHEEADWLRQSRGD